MSLKNEFAKRTQRKFIKSLYKEKNLENANVSKDE